MHAEKGGRVEVQFKLVGSLYEPSAAVSRTEAIARLAVG